MNDEEPRTTQARAVQGNRICVNGRTIPERAANDAYRVVLVKNDDAEAPQCNNKWCCGRQNDLNGFLVVMQFPWGGRSCRSERERRMTTAELRTGRNERLSMQITRQGVVRKDGCQGRVACWANSQRVAVVP